MTVRKIISLTAALMPVVFVCLAAVEAPVASENIIEQRGEVTFETSWYPRSAAYDGQKKSFLHVEAQPELLVFGNNAENYGTETS